MDTATELVDFLKTRRARLTPKEVGILSQGRARRVQGLRREEVAALAGISVEYYTKLERGKVSGISASVFEGLSRALCLDETERAYLAALVAVSGPATAPSSRHVDTVTAVLHRILAAMAGIPAYVRNERFEILAANEMAEALYSLPFATPDRPVNTAKYLFLDPGAAGFFPDWDGMADLAVSHLRASAVLDPHDRDLADVIAELSSRSDAFRAKWADHRVRLHQVGTKRFNHPVVGELILDFQAFEVAGQPGLRMNTYTTAPATPTAQRLAMLSRWAATPRIPKQAARVTEEPLPSGAPL